MIGALTYVAEDTRPDLSFVVSTLARHVQAPTPRNASLLKLMPSYLAGTIELGLQFPPNTPVTPTSLVGHVDADWGCRKTRHSTSYVITISGGAIYWKVRDKRSLRIPPNWNMLQFRHVAASK